MFKNNVEKEIISFLKNLDSLVNINRIQAKELIKNKMEEIGNKDFLSGDYNERIHSIYLYKTIFSILKEENFNNKDLINNLLLENQEEHLANTIISDKAKLDFFYMERNSDNKKTDIINRFDISYNATINYKDTRKIIMEIDNLKEKLLNMENNQENIKSHLDKATNIYNKDTKITSPSFLAKIIAPEYVEHLYANYLISIQNSINIIDKTIETNKNLSKEDIDNLKYEILEKKDVFGSSFNDYVRINGDKREDIKEIFINLENNKNNNEDLKGLKKLLEAKKRDINIFKESLNEWNNNTYNELIKTKSMPQDTQIKSLDKNTNIIKTENINLYVEARLKNPNHFMDKINEILNESKFKINRHTIDLPDEKLSSILKLDFNNEKSPFKTNEIDVEIQKKRNDIINVISNKLETYGVFNLGKMEQNQQNRELLNLIKNDNFNNIDNNLEERLKEMRFGMHPKRQYVLSLEKLRNLETKETLIRDLLDFKDYEDYNKIIDLSLDNQMEIFKNYKQSLTIINPLEANNLEKLFQESIKNNEQTQNMYKQKLAILNSKLNTTLKDGELIEINNELAKTKEIIDKIDRNNNFFKSIDRTNLNINKKEQDKEIVELNTDTLEKRAWLEKNITSIDVVSQILKFNLQNNENKEIISSIFSEESMQLLNLINSLNESVLELDRLGINNSESESLKLNFVILSKEFNEKILIEIKNKYKIDISDKDMIQDKEEKIIEQNIKQENKHSFRDFI